MRGKDELWHTNAGLLMKLHTAPFHSGNRTFECSLSECLHRLRARASPPL